MTLCPHTGLTIPECACAACVARQLERFAPETIVVRRGAPRERPSGKHPQAPSPSASERIPRQPL